MVFLAAGSAQANRARGAAGPLCGSLVLVSGRATPSKPPRKVVKFPEKVFEQVACGIWVGGK